MCTTSLENSFINGFVESMIWKRENLIYAIQIIVYLLAALSVDFIFGVVEG